jgi:hypothetical protein
MILSQFLKVAYLFVVDKQCLNWHIPLGGSIGLCEIEFDLISNFIWFGFYKVRVYLVIMGFEIQV